MLRAALSASEWTTPKLTKCASSKSNPCYQLLAQLRPNQEMPEFLVPEETKAIILHLFTTPGPEQCVLRKDEEKPLPWAPVGLTHPSGTKVGNQQWHSTGPSSCP